MKVKIHYPKQKCAYCGKIFEKQHNRQIYCSEHCRTEARREKRRRYNYKYYTQNRKRLHQTLTGTRTIGPNRNPDPEREAEIVQNEIERIGLHLHF